MKKKIYLVLTVIMVMAGLKTNAQVPAPDFDVYASYIGSFADLDNGPDALWLTYSMNDSRLSHISNGGTPPPSTPGAFVIINFTGTFNTRLSTGGPFTWVAAPASAIIKVTYDHTTGSTNYYQTEMLQLNISGGSLPSGVMIRESPTLASGGDCIIAPNGGYFLVTCFVDVLTELSTNGGSSWTPTSAPASRLVIKSHTFVTSSDHLQPTGSTYANPGVFCSVQTISGEVVEVKMLNIISTSPPPPSVSGAFVIINSNGTANLTYNNTPVSAPVTIVTKVTYDQTIGSTRFFDTEMLQLTLSGGSLPPGVQVRESPTLASTGKTMIKDIGGGQYEIHSFFDVFTELSIDGGGSWTPSSTPPNRLEVQDNSSSSIPTLSEWGLIALSVLVVGMAVVFVRKINLI